jgi:hypothetical protein
MTSRLYPVSVLLDLDECMLVHGEMVRWGDGEMFVCLACATTKRLV